MTAPEPLRTITALDRNIAALSSEDRARFERILRVRISSGRIEPPASMHNWIQGYFGSVDAVRQQRIVRVTNLVTLEGALFNSLRANQPIEAPHGSDDIEERINQSTGGPFCYPIEGTPADSFGRLQGRFSVTATNVAKYDAWHGVIIFDEHHPLRFTADQVSDYVETAQAWARAAHAEDPQACYPFFLWNCMWRSGASILHGHAQMTIARDMHYARVESWRQAALRYQAANGTNYFSDLVTVHRALGLAIDYGEATILTSLTPFKEKETHLLAPRLNSDSKEALYLLLHTFVEDLGVQSFNLVLYQPPLVQVEESWEGFPYLFRLIDRGDPRNNRSDVGAMEMFAQSVVTTDPYRVADALRTRAQERIL